MTGGFDNGPGLRRISHGTTGREQDPAIRGVLVAVLEPGTATDAPAGRLVSEVRRLASKAGWQSRFVTWRESAEDDVVDGGAVAALAEHLAAAAAAAGEDGPPLVVLLADSVKGREVAVLLAHRLACGVVLGCSDVRLEGEPGGGQLVFVKPVHGGWLEREGRLVRSGPLVVTLDLTGLEGADAELPGEVQVVKVASRAQAEVGSTPVPIRRLESIPPDPRTVDLVHAERIVAVGAGAATDRLLTAARELADLLEGSIGATRPVVDEGWLPKERLIGQTGKTVGPDLYLALGISGSPHHMAGVQRAGRVLSVNRDSRAPIFGLGDLGFVADLEAVLPALVEKIKRWRDEEGAAFGREEGDGLA